MKKLFLLPLYLLLYTALVATPAPDFTVTTSDGQVRKLYQDYVNQQKVMVLEIFFTTCPPCASHAPHLQSLYTSMQATYPGEVEFMLLSIMQADTDPVVNAYLTAKGLTMPAAGSSGGSLAAVQPYQSGMFGPYQGTPTFVVIAPGTGEVYYDIRGNSPQQTMALLSQQIADLLPQEQECSLKSYYDNPIDSVQINVETAGGGFSTSFWASGTYSLSDIPELQNAGYSITPVKNSDPLSGLSTFDLVKIASHILDLQPFANPWQAIAADMNCSGTVTTFDIVEGRKVILGINNGFSGCGGATWKFVSDTMGMASNGACFDFRGVKIGDITGAYFAPNDIDDRDRSPLLCQNRWVEKGKSYTIPVFSGREMKLAGLQLAMGIDPGALRITGIRSDVLPGFDESAYNMERQNSKAFVPLSWIGAGAPVDLTSGENLLIVEVEALKDVFLADVLDLDPALKAEAYGRAGERLPLELRWSEMPFQGLKNYSISPNPANGRFFVSLEAERAGGVLLQLLDMQGKTVLADRRYLIDGSNRLEIIPGDVSPGLYTLKIDGLPAGKVVLEK
jgi:thiol-disulfide isomerase/thioredoxin